MVQQNSTVSFHPFLPSTTPSFQHVNFEGLIDYNLFSTSCEIGNTLSLLASLVDASPIRSPHHVMPP
ncbi:unnamed protein product [Trifolium pratense]|uniref:Uncharacterized protein n=1 Tax=Trifolium pratense TaxID=57577 RepID=A0ACB0M0S5_TRIPR|nr:unnamed protein product [Trifolium pratense]